MIFASYTGKAEPGVWTPGKIYFAMAGFQGGKAVVMDKVRMQSDDGQWREVKTSGNQFAFPASIFAVVLSRIGSFLKGEVVEIIDVDDEQMAGERFFKVKRDGYLNANLFEVLDRTNVEVGNWVLVMGKWEQIAKLDDKLNIGISDAPEGTQGSEMVTPLLCRFPVSGTSIASEPMLRCVKAEPGELTEGKMYRPLADHDGLVSVTNDTGRDRQYLAERFSEEL